MNSPHKTLHEYKTNYERILLQQDNTSWTDYWAEMGQEGTWVDSVFVQVTAWYIGIDIQILTTSAKPENPFILLTGNIDNTSISSSGPPILLGNYTNVHYQPLLPLSKYMRIQHQPRKRTSAEDNETDENSTADDFIYMHNGVQITFPNLSEKLQCPFCSESFIRLASHIASKKCNISKLNIDITELTSQLNSFTEGFRLEMGRKRKQKSRIKLREEKGTEVIKAEQNKQIQKSRKKLREEKGTKYASTEKPGKIERRKRH